LLDLKMLEEAADAATDDVRLTRPKVIGRYALFGEIASGGMATVHFGRLVGPVGFSRTVAIKRLHPHYARDPEFLGMFMDEARLASRIAHPNVVKTLDVVNVPTEVFLVMEYVAGESLSRLLKNATATDRRMPPDIVASVMAGMLNGLHAAHEAKSERQEPLEIVHRDVSPHNVLVGTDGVARVLDFGVAKAALRSHSTNSGNDGKMKGKLSYMSPEQLNGREVDRRTDLFAAGAVLFEALTGQRLFEGDGAGEILGKVLSYQIPDPATLVDGLPPAFSEITARALERDPDKRYQTAREFAVAIEHALPLATARKVGEWVESVSGAALARRAEVVAALEHLSSKPEELLRLERGAVPDDDAGDVPELPALGGSPGRSEADDELTSVDAGQRRISSHSSTSHVSNLAVPSAPEERLPRRRRVTLIWGSALAVALLIIGIAARHRGALRPAAFDSGIHAASAGPTKAMVPEMAPAASVALGRNVGVAPSAPVTQAVEAVSKMTPSASALAPGTSASARAGERTNVKTPKKAARESCDPPFTFDAHGIKRVKPGCY
jgi:serine/threonine-protein kinase